MGEHVGTHSEYAVDCSLMFSFMTQLRLFCLNLKNANYSNFFKGKLQLVDGMHVTATTFWSGDSAPAKAGSMQYQYCTQVGFLGGEMGVPGNYKLWEGTKNQLNSEHFGNNLWFFNCILHLLHQGGCWGGGLTSVDILGLYQEQFQAWDPLFKQKSPTCVPILPHLGVGGSIDDFSFAHPSDGGGRLGIVCVARQVEGVSCSQADDGAPHNDGIIWRNWKETAQRR